jgi:hypothetical protein
MSKEENIELQNKAYNDMFVQKEEILDSNAIPRVTQEIFYVIITDEFGFKKTTIDIGFTLKDLKEKLEVLQNYYDNTSNTV